KVDQGRGLAAESRIVHGKPNGVVVSRRNRRCVPDSDGPIRYGRDAPSSHSGQCNSGGAPPRGGVDALGPLDAEIMEAGAGGRSRNGNERSRLKLARRHWNSWRLWAGDG